MRISAKNRNKARERERERELVERIMKEYESLDARIKYRKARKSFENIIYILRVRVHIDPLDLSEWS